MTTNLDHRTTFEAQNVAMDSVTAVSLGVPGRRFFPAHAYVIVTTAPSTMGTCVVSIGTNSPDYDNVVPATDISALATTDLGREIEFGDRPVIPGDAELFLNISTAATDGGALHSILNGWFFDYDIEVSRAQEQE